jgi:uncharacterized protein YndB with AHSA1/START domain/ketosteroid isomerase-like protein
MTHTTSPSRHGTVTRDGRRGTIRFERILDHAVDRVWEAITSPEGLAGWWLPFEAAIEIDLTVGGLLSFSAPELGDAPMTCEILEVEAPRRLVFTHFGPSTTLTWELAAVGEGTRLVLTQDTPDIAAAIQQGQIVGLHHSLDRLAPSLDGEPAPWDWDRLPVIEAEYAELLGDVVPTHRRRVVDRYVDGFRSGDHDAIHACLTDDVTWDIVGHATAAGRAEFDALIDGPEGASLPTLRVGELVEAGDVIVAFGSGEFTGPDGTQQSFRFADSFTFRENVIAAVVSYVVPT